jgi:hypothetical protein
MLCYFFFVDYADRLQLMYQMGQQATPAVAVEAAAPAFVGGRQQYMNIGDLRGQPQQLPQHLPQHLPPQIQQRPAAVEGDDRSRLSTIQSANRKYMNLEMPAMSQALLLLQQQQMAVQSGEVRAYMNIDAIQGQLGTHGASHMGSMSVPQ